MVRWLVVSEKPKVGPSCGTVFTLSRLTSLLDGMQHSGTDKLPGPHGQFTRRLVGRLVALIALIVFGFAGLDALCIPKCKHQRGQGPIIQVHPLC